MTLAAVSLVIRVRQAPPPAVVGYTQASRVTPVVRSRSAASGTVTRAVEGLIASGEIPVQPVKPLAILLLGAMNESGFALARGEAGVTINGCVVAMERLLKGRG